MNRQCRICNHNMVSEINRECLSGRSLASIAQKFGVPYNSLYNHAGSHISRQLTQAMEKKQTAENFDLLHRIDTIVNRAEDIFTRNYNSGKDLTALKALAEQRATFDLLAKISFQLHQAKQAELELARIQSGEITISEETQFQQNLAVLSVEELKVMQRLIEKLETQDSNIQVLDFLPTSPTLFISDNMCQHSGCKCKGNGTTMKRTKAAGQERLESMRVRQVQSQVILG
jgi:hypothetical protein